MPTFGVCRSIVPGRPIPPDTSWQSLKNDLGIGAVRLTPSLNDLFPERDVTRFADMDAHVQAIKKAGLTLYLNPTWCPAWASEGKPAYVGLIIAEKDGTIGGSAWWDDPANPAGIHFFGDKPEIDGKQPPRPYLPDPPHIDPDAMAYFGKTLAERYGDEVDLWGLPLNEPDIAFFYPPIRIDGVNKEGGPDTVNAWLGPHVVTPYCAAVRDVLSRRSVPRQPTFVGAEVATGGMLQRCIQWGDIKSGHWYAWGQWPDDSYRRIQEDYLPLVAGRSPFICGEIDGPEVPADDAPNAPVSIVDWTRHVLGMGTGVSAIYYLDSQRFYTRSWEQGNTSLNRTGQALRDLIATTNTRRHAASHG